MKKQNYLCDGEHCQDPNGEVRLLPYGNDGGNLIVCRACFDYEIKELDVFEPLKWEDLEVYRPE